MRSARSRGEDFSVQLAIKGPAPSAAPQAQGPATGKGIASAKPQADFSRMLVEQAGLENIAKPASPLASSTTAPAKTDPDGAASPGQDLSSTSLAESDRL